MDPAAGSGVFQPAYSSRLGSNGREGIEEEAEEVYDCRDPCTIV